MIEVDRQWLVVRFGQIAGDGDHVTGSGIAECAGRTRHDQRRAHLRGRFNDHLQRFEIMNIECRYGVTFALCFQQHRFRRDDEHLSSETFRFVCAKEGIGFRNIFL